MTDHDGTHEIERTRQSQVSVGVPGVFGYRWQAEKRWTARGKLLGQRVRELTGMSEKQLEAAVTSSDATADVASVVTERAIMSADEDYREVLARALAAVFEDDAVVDEAAYLCSELAKLEPLHLRAMRSFLAVGRGGQVAGGHDGLVSVTTSPSRVAAAAGVPRSVAYSICARLEGAGLIDRQANRVRDDLTVALSETFEITPWGRHIVRKLLTERVDGAS